MADGLPGPGRINSALERGGPDLLVRSITGLLGVEVDHYVQVDFAGAVALADAVGGIRVAVDRPIRDEATGIELAAGCQTLDGEATLGLDRSRRIEIRGPDGVWTQDPSSAVGRDVRAAAVAAALLQAAARIDVHDLPTLVRTGLDWLTVDALLDTEDLVDWARRSRDDRYVPLSLPVADATVAGAQVLQLDDGAAHVVAAFLAGGDPRPPAPPRRAPAIENTGLRPC